MDKVKCCDSPSCGPLIYKTAMALSCYSLRTVYMKKGCDKVYPTKRDHPEAAAQAYNKFKTCSKLAAECLACQR